MLSLGAMKDGVILPSEEDRKRIITQMKVRTTLKGDKSWIHHKSDSEEKQNHSPLTPCTAPSSHREPQSPSAQKNLSPNSSTATSSSGYLIRGVFTKTIDKSSPSKTASNETQKSVKSPSQTSPTTQGPKMSTEDYKKLAPYNIKRELSYPADGQPSVSPEEQKKRTEAASSVLRRTAGRERSYVLSAAKKTGGSPAQEVSAIVAKKIDVPDDFGPRSRSQTVPASAWFNSRGKSTNGERRTSESPQNESRLANTSVRTNVDTNSSRNVASEPHLETSFNYSTPVESSNKSDEKYEMSPGHDSVPRVPTSPKRSEKNETQSRTFFDKSVLEYKHEVSNGERKPKDPDSKATEFFHHQPTTEKENTEVYPGMGYRTSLHLDNNEGLDSKRSELQPGESSLSTTGSQCELLSIPKREELDMNISRYNSFATESRITCPQNQYQNQRSGEDSDRIFSHLDRQAGHFIRSSESRNGINRNNQLYNRRMLGFNNGIASYLYNQPFNSRSMSYYPFRDAGNSIPKSHRVPFYKDICDTESGRNLTDSEAKDLPASFEQKNFSNYESDSSASGKGLLFVKESIKSMEMSSSPRYNSRSLVDLSELENPSYSSTSYLNNTSPKRSLEDICTYCGRVIRNCAKISIENLNISCHEYCFKCGICHKPMGNLLDQIFIHRDIVHCDKCYEKLF
ncbi:zinc finger protein 185 isoform X1 [Notechis scutatus]|uniref:Zinc finger protein 185 isoform X1 n=1 Tax=Notechis scutatus TaxID=8663 RepID=A0A6J1US14_9SAUR|nr:zinc finger protein 185 isoform X1 [Notechis scutatus]